MKQQPSDDTEASKSDYEERLRKFNDRLRYSEDLGTAKPKIKERRTYSDDYDEKTRRSSTRSTRSAIGQDGRHSIEKKRPSDVNSKSRASYTEGNPAKRDSDASIKSRSSYTEGSPLKRDSDASIKSRGSHSEGNPSKRDSDASIKSKGSHTEGNPAKRDSRDAGGASVALCATKRSSVDCKSTRKMVELPPRRAFSQTEERPSTPVPPAEWNNDRYATTRLKQLSERQKRDSTRYKVYLT